jgi:hypothetical protein
MPRRKAITPEERDTALATELIEFCQTITEDGRLTHAEVDALGDWLRANRSSGLPAIEHLTAVLDSILADGIITPPEVRKLYSAIERVLPPDVREVVRSARLEQDRQERAARSDAAARAREERRALRERNAAIGYWDFMVAGVRYEGRSDVVELYANIGDGVALIRDRENPYSRNAVEVQLLSGHQIGYVPEVYARAIAPVLDQGAKYNARIKKLLMGSRYTIPVVVVTAYRADADVPTVDVDLQPVAARDSDQAQPTAAAPGCGGCGCVILIGLATASVALALGVTR